MHTKCLGTDSSLLGSCLLYLVKEVMPGAIEDNLSMVWSSIKGFYRANKTSCRLGNLTLKMLKNEPFPRLAAKAMEIKCLLPAIEELLQPWLPGNVQLQWFHRLVALSRLLDDIVFGNKSFLLSEPERVQLRAGIFQYNQLLTQLARHFHTRGLPYCNFLPKIHFLMHIGVNTSKSGVSPRLAWCFQGEDFMSLLKSLCTSSSRGIDSAKLVMKVNEKYLRGLDLLFSQA